MSDFDNEDSLSNDGQEYEEGISDEGKLSVDGLSRWHLALFFHSKFNSCSSMFKFVDTEDASETDMLKYEGEFSHTEIKEQ